MDPKNQDQFLVLTAPKTGTDGAVLLGISFWLVFG